MADAQITITLKQEAYDAIETARLKNGRLGKDPKGGDALVVLPNHASVEAWVDSILTQQFERVLRAAGVGGSQAEQIEEQINTLQTQLAAARKPTVGVSVKK